MRKWRFTRKAVSPTETMLLALIAAIVIHAVFLLPGYRIQRVKTDSASGGAQMLNLVSLEPRQQRQFQNWLFVHDPARVARSYSASGYSAVLEGNRSYQVKISPYKADRQQKPVAVTGFSPLTVPDFAGRGVPESSVEKQNVSAFRREVKVLDHAGKEIKGLIGKIPESSGSSQPTVVELIPVGKVVRTALALSCGDQKLDFLAQAAVSRLEVKEKTVVTVIWPGRAAK